MQPHVVEQLVEQSFNMPLSALLAPIGEQQVGENVRHNGVYYNIKQARQQDDPTIPTGVWQHDLKVADWHKVRQEALSALCEKSKDLQLGVWLLEANIQLQGFAGIAPACYLIILLCEHYWDKLHPQMEEGDLEYRTNIIDWIDSKITPQLRLLPLARDQANDKSFCWDDWQNAQRYEQLKAQNQLPDNWSGLLLKDIKAQLQYSDGEFMQQQWQDLQQAIISSQKLQHWFEQACGEARPSLSHFIGQQQAMANLYAAELSRRGINLTTGDEPDSEAQNTNKSAEADNESAGGGAGGTPPPDNPDTITSREQAYEQLRKVAEYLVNEEPHSLVPYLVITAYHWSGRSAPDLYHEVFHLRGGQLNVYEMMGLEREQQ